MTTDYTVVGMTCGHCVNAVTEEVSAVPGVSKAYVDLATGRLTITEQGSVDPEAVRGAVEEAGYQLAAS